MEENFIGQEIKPKILNKGFIIIQVIFILFLLLIIAERDYFVASVFTIFMFLIQTSIIVYFNKKLILLDDKVRYKYLFSVTEIDFKDIYKVGLYSNGNKGAVRHSLVIDSKSPLIITDIQLYKKTDILKLLNSIKCNNPSICIEGIVMKLENIKWVKMNEKA